MATDDTNITSATHESALSGTADRYPSDSALIAPAEAINKTCENYERLAWPTQKQTQIFNERISLPFAKQKQKVGWGKSVRRRAALACVRCQARKVRCTAIESIPCLNCKGHNVECVLTVKHWWHSSQSLRADTLREAEVQAQLRLNVPESDRIPSSATKRRSSIPAIGLKAALSTNMKVLATPALTGNSRYRLSTSSTIAPVPGISDALSSRSSLCFEGVDFRVGLPAFLKPLPSSITQHDVKYIYAKGALTLPPTPLQNALLHAYVDYIHPYMPVLELFDFLTIINARNSLFGEISLLLYQAVMFAATAFVDAEALHAAGYPSRKKARTIFFQKTKLLYDFEYETDRLVLVQSLLLMTYWQQVSEDHKDMWHWLGIAISQANTIGLQHNPATLGLSSRKEKLRKRIWWCCVMRDHLIALGMRQPLRIKDEDFDVPMLQESDFDTQILPGDNTTVPSDCIFVRDAGIQQELASLCVSKARLCIYIGHILTAQYTPHIRNSEHGQNTAESTMKLSPRQTSDFESIASIDAELLDWAESLFPVCQPRSLTPLDVEHGRKSVTVHCTMLHMLYWTAMITLHRPQFLPVSSIQASTMPVQMHQLSQQRVQDAALNVSRMASELHKYGLDKYLPTTGVTVILVAMVINLLGMKNSTELFDSQSWHRYCDCLHVLEKLQEMYPGAELAKTFLNEALLKVSIDINCFPEEVIQPSRPPSEPIISTNAWVLNKSPLAPRNQTQYTGVLSLKYGFLPPANNSSVLDTCGTSPTEDRGATMGCLASNASGGLGEASSLDINFEHNEPLKWSASIGAEDDADEWLRLLDGFNEQN